MNKNDFYEALAQAQGKEGTVKSFNFTQTNYTESQYLLIKQKAQEFLSTPIPCLPFSLFKLYAQTGDRHSYESKYFEKRGRLFCYAVCLYKEPENEQYKEALEDIIWDICSEPFWCIPAHFAGYNGAPLSFDLYSTQLDLFASETAFALSEALHMCEKLINPQVSLHAQEQLKNRVFDPFCNGKSFFRFETMPNNWASVCAGAIGGAAIYMVNDINALSSIFSRVQSCLDLYISSFGDDGICVEGVDYWTYGFGFFVCYADLLYHKTNCKIDLFEDKKVERIARSFSAFYLDKSSTLSFSDGSEESKYRAGLISYLAARYKNYTLPPIECKANILDDTCYRFCLAIRDLAWNKDISENKDKDTTKYFEDAKWYIHHGQNYSFAAKGGNNDESHNHNDCGEFILAKNGKQIICDLGAGLYNAEYFGENRYDVFVNRSLSHNIALINGKEQKNGAQYSATDESATDNSFEMKLQNCYDDSSLQEYSRKFTCNTSEIILDDVFSFIEESEITEIFVSKFKISLNKSGANVLSEYGDVDLLFNTEEFDSIIEEKTYFDHKGILQTVYCLHITNKTKSKLITFKAVLK